MFGNVLNLRHLAQLVGSDRPFYGVQARGLYGDHQPHETFEEMAADYIAELRTVQPQGPYLLGGFSGGGITAYEMARQLPPRARRSPSSSCSTPRCPRTSRCRCETSWPSTSRTSRSRGRATGRLGREQGPLAR